MDRRHDERPGDHARRRRPATGRRRRQSYTETLAARTLENAGSGTWDSTDSLSQTAGSLLENLAHATLTIQSGVSWNPDSGTLDNQYQATITVDAGTGTSTLDG